MEYTRTGAEFFTVPLDYMPVPSREGASRGFQLEVLLSQACTSGQISKVAASLAIPYVTSPTTSCILTKCSYSYVGLTSCSSQRRDSFRAGG